jgi:OOP family OmpA-OmpF porin
MLGNLRDIVLEPHERRLAFLERRLEGLHEQIEDVRERAEQTDVEDIARVLPWAVSASSRDDGKLAHAMRPILEEGLEESVRRNPQPLVDVIFPVLGPAIRKAIASAMRSVLASVNRTVESAFTPRGLRWRIEAWRTKRSYAEVVLAHTILYRVEGVYLIHRETGLLLQHVVPPEVEAQHPELVSSMLTAIKDFARDAFAAREDGDLEQFRVGDLTVLAEHGPQALLALAVRGSPPPTLRTVMQETLEGVHSEFREPLLDFDGRNAVFETARPALEECLRSEVRTRKKFPLGAAMAATALVVVAALLAASWIRGRVRDEEWDAYLQRLEAQPGLVVVGAEEDGGTYRLVGLRDPLAPDPWSLLRDHDLDPQIVDARWEPYRAQHPDFVLARARRVLRPPADVTLALEDGVLRVRGVATGAWMHDAERLALLVPGVDRWDAAALRDRRVAQLDAPRAAVESLRLAIDDRPDGGAGVSRDALLEARRRIGLLDIRAHDAGVDATIRVLAPRGPAPEVARRHARFVRDQLLEERWKATTIEVAGEPSPEAGAGLQLAVRLRLQRQLQSPASRNLPPDR